MPVTSCRCALCSYCLPLGSRRFATWPGPIKKWGALQLLLAGQNGVGGGHCQGVEAHSVLQATRGGVSQLSRALFPPPHHPPDPVSCRWRRQRCRRYEEALQCYERAQMVCPASGPTYAGLGYASQCLGDYSRAIDCYHKVSWHSFLTLNRTRSPCPDPKK